MGSTQGKAGKPAIIPADEASALDHFCPDLSNWPQSWRYEEAGVAIGQEIVGHLKPFLLDLMCQPLADKTRARHRDRLWMLGGEIIWRRHDDPDLAKRSVNELIGNFIEEDGGPLIWPRITEAEQNAFDATCRKLYRFLQQEKTP
jgi:hypothetical protein